MAAQQSKSWLRRGSRIAPLCLLGLTACVATKSDVRKITQEMARINAASQANLDESRQATARELRILQDSIRSSTELMRTMRGQLTNDIRQLQQLLSQLQELFAQNEARITQLREAMDRVQTAPAQPQAGAQQPGGTGPEELYQLGVQKLQDSPATAEIIFQQIITEFPMHERAADAQFFVGETRATQGRHEEAIATFENVAERHPTHVRAAQALLRAGDIAAERATSGPSSARSRMRTKARELYNKILTNYKDSGEATVARSALSRLPR